MGNLSLEMGWMSRVNFQDLFPLAQLVLLLSFSVFLENCECLSDTSPFDTLQIDRSTSVETASLTKGQPSNNPIRHFHHLQRRQLSLSGNHTQTKVDYETTTVPQLEMGFVNHTEAKMLLSMPRDHDPTDLQYSDGYWVRVAQAQALAIAVENGTLPRLDENSEIMLPSDCRKEHDEQCRKLLKDHCADKRATELAATLSQNGEKSNPDDVSLYLSTIFNNCNFENNKEHSFNTLLPAQTIPMPKLKFFCNSHKGQGESETTFLLNYTDYSVLDIPKDFIPRFFVIELGNRGHWHIRRESVQPYWLYKFNTQVGESYRIRVTPVTPKYVLPPVVSEVFTVYSPSQVTYEKPKDFEVVKISLNYGASRPSPSALLRWKSGSGSNASCHWDVYFMDYDDAHFVKRTKGDESFWARLDQLKFGTNYSIRIIEYLGAGKETKLESHLHIPTCLEMRYFSFEHCAPPPVSNIQLINATSDEFRIAWDPPKFTNQTNRILHYNVTLQVFPEMPLLNNLAHGSAPFDMQSYTHHQGHAYPKTEFSYTVPGNVTFLEVRNMKQIKGGLRVSIVAFATAGESPVRWKIVHFDGVTGNDWSLWKILTLVFVAAGVVFLVFLFCALKHMHERRERTRKRHEKFETLERESLQMECIFKDSTKWEIECCDLDLREGIGQGNFGIVRRAILNQRGKKMVVAVKTLRDGVDRKDVDKLWEEYEILKSLDTHVHVVGLKGIVTRHVPFPLLVVEYCDGGDLQSHLRKLMQSCKKNSRMDPALSSGESSQSSLTNLTNSSPRVVMNAAYFMKSDHDQSEESLGPGLTIADLLSYARQISVGMEYLSSNKIVHRDLATRNILISGKSRILKISDFGLSRDVYEQNLYKKRSKGEIPFKWLAIESILNEIYTTKSDVWSFGILLWEIFTYGGNPYPGVDNMKVFDLLKDGYRMTRPDTCPVEVYELMRLCWNDEPNRRPDFTGIRLILEEILEKTTNIVYLNLETAISARYRNCDSGFDEPEVASGDPELPPRNKK